MKSVLRVLFLVVIAGCERVDVSFDSGRLLDDPAHIYAVAVEYPAGYDWRKDSLGGRVGRLVLYKDWKPEIGVDVGQTTSVSTDADMHRIIGGHLYTDFSDGGSTIVGCEGKELFRYDGREAIKSMVVENDTSVLTLGLDRNGGGWSFRRNGRKLLSQRKGLPLGQLYQDGGELCFAYKIPLASIDDSEQATQFRYYVVRGMSEKQIVPESDISGITAIRVNDGEVNYLAFSSSISGLIWQKGDTPVILGVKGSKAITDCSFHKAGGELYAHSQSMRVLSSAGGLIWSSMLWRGDGLEVDTQMDGVLYSFCENSPQMCFVCTEGGRSYPVVVYYGDRKDTVASEMSMISPYAIACDAGGYYLGLNDRSRAYRPVVMHGSDTIGFDFNGYFTRFSVQ